MAKEISTWAVVADFFGHEQSRWLDDFIKDDHLRFEKIPARKTTTAGRPQGWHFQRGRTTSLTRWLTHLSQIQRAFMRRPDGIITVFPQLAMVAGLTKRLRRLKTPIIAYTYNLGALPRGIRQRLSRFAAKAIDVFIVHSPSEIAPYAAYLGVPEDRVVFVPLQRGTIDLMRNERTDAPFVLAMGSAHRDYATLIAAVDALKIATVIVTRPDDIADLPKSDHVTYKTHLTQSDCLELLARARLSVTPIANLDTASGQITFVDALRIGVPTIATRCPGSDGYIKDGETGLLVAPFDVDDMKRAIAGLWDNRAERARLSRSAMQDAGARFTDNAAANALHDLIRRTPGS